MLSFESPIHDLESKIRELRHLSSTNDLDIVKEIGRLEKKLTKLLQDTYEKLTPWQKVQVARHQERPRLSTYIKNLIEDFVPLKGDRCFGEDPALTAGMGTFRGRSVMVLGHEKGHDTESRIHHNFGMPRPEGYRKAVRAMELADRFALPLLCFVDTAGAHPGIEAEERGQAEAIASSIESMLKVSVPVLSVITGEGGSGGAIALAAANRVLMLQHAVYSVISPEGCASILWRLPEKKEEAASAQKLTAQDLLPLGVIDEIIPEPLGGAHRSPLSAIKAVGDALEKHLGLLQGQKNLAKDRQEKFLAMGNT